MILSTSRRSWAAGFGFIAATAVALAAEAPAPTEGEPAPGTVLQESDARGQAYAEFKRLFDTGEYAAAAEQASKVVALTEDAHGGSAEERQVALMNLGLAQQRAGDYLSAESSYRRVIELIEASGRRTSPRLARAYAGLGITYHAAHRYDLAAASLDRAIALNRRAEGLFNAGQLPLLEKQADALTELGRGEEAMLAQRYALRIVARQHGEHSLPYARQLESLGRWYTRVRSYEAGRATLRQCVGLVEELAGAESIALVGPLSGFADNARRWLTDPLIRQLASADDARSTMFHDPVLPAPPGLSPSTVAAEGLKALERAAAIADADPDAAPSLVAGVHAQLGDWHTARQLPQRARPSYERAWAAAAAAPDGAALQTALFGAPALIHYVLPDHWDRYAQRPPEEVERRDVEIELTVTGEGAVRDARVVAGGDDPQLASQALRAAGTARYRPRLVDGTPVDTPGVRFVQPFYVLREEDRGETPASASPAPPPAQGGG
jgi:tetratricopeptide (TPR) repeat protein